MLQAIMRWAATVTSLDATTCPVSELDCSGDSVNLMSHQSAACCPKDSESFYFELQNAECCIRCIIVYACPLVVFVSFPDSPTARIGNPGLFLLSC
jgi:hypothetical protein